jgi:hypothetical protein
VVEVMFRLVLANGDGMRTSRRKFLGWMGLVLATGAAGAWWRFEPLRGWLVSAGLAPAPTGSLRDSTADTLRAAVLALLEERVDPRHYLDCFRWRARHVPGARALYERFEATVDRAARAGGASGFRSAGGAHQRRILEGMLPARGLRRIPRLLIARDEARFARHIVREIFRRFAVTDAWVLAGYDAWPGMPRAIGRLRAAGPRR